MNKDELLYYLLSQKKKKDDIIIQPREDVTYFPMTSHQEEFYLLDQLQPDDLALNLSFSYELRGDIKIDALEKAFSAIIDRHEIFRTAYVFKEDYLQIVLRKKEFKLNVITIPDDINDKITFSRNIISEMLHKRFDLNSGDVFKVALLKLSHNHYILWWCFHHIVSDAWGQKVFIKELKDYYAFYAFRKDLNLNELSVQCGDYAIWQRSFFAKENMKRKIENWCSKLDGIKRNLTLPTDYVRPIKQTFNGNTLEFDFNDLTRGMVKKFAKEKNTTVFSVLFTGVNLLIYKYTKETDIVVGSPYSIRNHKYLEPIICDLSTMLIYRSIFTKDDSLDEVLVKVQNTIYNTLENNDVPFQNIYDRYKEGHDKSYSPLFQIMFVFHQFFLSEDEQLLDEIDSKYFFVTKEASQFDFSVFIFDDECRGMYGKIEYNTDLYKKETILKYINDLEQIIVDLSSNSNKKIYEL